MTFACCAGHDVQGTVTCYNAGSEWWCDERCASVDASHCWMMPGFVCEARPCQQFRFACCTQSGCTVRTWDDCINQLRGIPMPDRTCTPDPCDTWACCWGDGSGNCSNRTLEMCRSGGGTWKFEQRCEDIPDPCPPGAACCVCRSQCLNTPSRSECSKHNGVWIGIRTCQGGGLSDCEHQHPDLKPPCGGARFKLTRDQVRDDNRFRPMSVDQMNADELVVGGLLNDCRLQWGNVSAKRGAWTCGQWDMTEAETKKNYPLRLSLDTNGRAVFHTRYRQTCRRYN